MTVILNKLDNLRKEKREIEYFIRGNGNFGININMKLFKHFGCGQHELIISNEQLTQEIMKILKNRLNTIDVDIKDILGLTEREK